MNTLKNNTMEEIISLNTGNDKPKLEAATFIFSQEANCMDGGDMEELAIHCKSDLGIDDSGGCFYVLETKGWSIDSPDDLNEIFERINKTLINQINK
jgi:hypothetical protein